MIKTDFRIARLIARHLSGEITPEEGKRLYEWRKESHAHEQLFQRMCSDEYRARHGNHRTGYDPQAGWIEVEKRIKRADFRRKCLMLMRYAAILATPILILVAALLDSPEMPSMDSSRLSATPQILPGGAKAILTLDNGETFYLDEDAGKRQAQWADKQFRVDSATLNYRAAHSQKAQAAPAYHKVEIPRGGEYALVLNDGTKVHLNSMSSLRFPVTFESGKREVELVGEAYFEVSKTGQPFIVSAQGMQVEVLGTTFNVSAYPDEECRATLVSGSVRVEAEGGRSLILKPSQQASLMPGSGEIQVRTVDAAFCTSWIKGKINFKDRRLEDIMKTLSRWYDIEVNYADEALKEKRFGCYVNRYEEIAPFLELLEATGNIRTGINRKTITFHN